MILKRVGIDTAESIYEKMELAFPYEERRDKNEHIECFNEKEFEAYTLEENGETVGFIDLWSFSDFVFLEHFAIDPQKRCGGYGSRALSELKKLAGARKIILEAEEPNGDFAARRIAFYERNGFVTNSYPYEQPSFHKESPVPLLVLSHPHPLTPDEFNTFKASLYKTAYKKYI